MTSPAMEPLNIRWRKVNSPDKQKLVRKALAEEGISVAPNSAIYELNDEDVVSFLAQQAMISLTAIAGFRASEQVLHTVRNGFIEAIEQMMIEQLGNGKSADVVVNDNESHRYTTRQILKGAGYKANKDGTMSPPTPVMS